MGRLYGGLFHSGSARRRLMAIRTSVVPCGISGDIHRPFSGDPSPGTPVFSRVFYGGAIIVLPTIFYAPEVTQLFISRWSRCGDADGGGAAVSQMALVSWPCTRSDRSHAVRLAFWP